MAHLRRAYHASLQLSSKFIDLATLQLPPESIDLAILRLLSNFIDRRTKLRPETQRKMSASISPATARRNVETRAQFRRRLQLESLDFVENPVGPLQPGEIRPLLHPWWWDVEYVGFIHQRFRHMRIVHKLGTSLEMCEPVMTDMVEQYPETAELISKPSIKWLLYQMEIGRTNRELWKIWTMEELQELQNFLLLNYGRGDGIHQATMPIRLAAQLHMDGKFPAVAPYPWDQVQYLVECWSIGRDIATTIDGLEVPEELMERPEDFSRTTSEHGLEDAMREVAEDPATWAEGMG